MLASQKRLAVLHVFAKKSQRAPPRAVPDHQGMDETGRAMKRLNDLKKRFIENPKFREEIRVDR